MGVCKGKLEDTKNYEDKKKLQAALKRKSTIINRCLSWYEGQYLST